MEIVVRTPHGDADVSILSHAAATTLGDVVSAVTGQAVPRLVLVDGRTVDAATELDDAELLLGSVVMSEPLLAPTISDADVEIVQIAGHGAGRITRLGPGRYRIGPGRRSSADELGVAPVERPAFELVVEPTDKESEVTVVPVRSGVAVDGVDLVGDTAWRDGTLTVGSRAFQLDNPARAEPANTVSQREPDGTLAFNRPPRRYSARDRRPVVDAVRDATHAAPTLWERRPNHPDAFELPIGVRVDGSAVVTVDLASDRAVAITGSERFRSALVRTVIVEAVTLHGPADVDLVVLTGTDRVADWDWAKWLPHLELRGRLARPPSIWSSRHEIIRWADDAQGRSSSDTPSLPSHLSLVILDDPGLWNRGDSPLRSILSNPPNDLRLMALCDDEAEAPALCTTVISEIDGDLTHVQSLTRADDGGILRAALTEVAVARRVARSLAPLADVELATPGTSTNVESDQVELGELVGAIDADHVLARWGAAETPATVPIGRRDTDVVSLSIRNDVIVVVGSSMGDAFDVAATSLLAQCVVQPPEALWIVPAALEHSARSELLWLLPHATDPHDLGSVIDPRRLLSRLRSVLADADGPTRAVVVVEATTASAPSVDDAWLTTLTDGVHSINGLTMVVITDSDAVADLVGDTMIRVERLHDTAGAPARRVATMTTGGSGSPGQAFTPILRTTSPVAGLELCPYVVGRALTPLERRVDQHQARSANAPDPAISMVVALLCDVAARHRHGATPAPGERTAVPPPMPARVDLDELFATSPGDGVPLGLVDDPSAARSRTQWWEPGSGSMLVFGSRRSGMEQALATILLGVIDRFSDLDVRLVIFESSSTRRRALEAIDRSMRIIAADRTDEVVDALDEIGAELDRRAAAIDAPDGPRMVVLIGDLAHLRRRYANQPVGARIDQMLARAALADPGVDVIASTSELDGAGPFASDAPRRLVGASSDHRELAALGVEHPSDLDGIVGRCRSFPGADLVQLAIADAPTETLLVRRSTGATP